MLGLWSIGSAPVRLRLRIAFSVALEDAARSVATLRSGKVVPRSGGGPAVDQLVVLPWMPAASVWFDDPDAHSLECIGLLPEDPWPERPGTVPPGTRREP